MQQVGRYEVIRELGQGGMGAVYLGRDRELQRSVALKLLHQDTAHALKHEGRALAALSHPGIVTIYEIGEHEGRQFIAMEYLPGRSLRHLLQHADVRPSRDAVVAIVRQVTVAVGAAHAAGILHRDIKPENVVVSETGVVKVVDFGIARRLDGELSLQGLATAQELPTGPQHVIDAFTRTIRVPGDGADTVVTGSTKTVFGTPAYMAPEVLMGEPSTEASDVYSLGVVLYECLSGRRPYDAPQLHVVMSLVIDGTEPIARLDDPLADLAARMLARDPEDRPSIAEIAAALEPAEPAAPPPPPRPRSRVPWILAGAALVIAGAIVIATGMRTPEPAPPRANSPGDAPPVAVEAFTVEFANYGVEQPRGDALADVVAILVTGFGHRVSSPDQLAAERKSSGRDLRAAARALGARYLVSGAIGDHAQKIELRLVIEELATSEKTKVELTTANLRGVPALLFDGANHIASAIDPGFEAEPMVHSRNQALALFAVGERLRTDRDWRGARPYLEQAVVTDPTFAAAWHELASVRGWSMAPQDLIDEAIDRAAELAPEGPLREVWRGAGQYYDGEFGAAITTLLPLRDAGLTGDNARDLQYYLAEAYWHDGDHETAVQYFRDLLRRDLKFKVAAIHVGEYMIARRRYQDALLMTGLLERPSSVAEFSAGHYEALENRADVFPENLHSQLVLGHPSTFDDRLGTDVIGTTLWIARAAGDGDVAKARALFAARWPPLAKRELTDGVAYQLESLGEVLLCARMLDELRLVLAYYRGATAPRARRGYHRMSILAAPLLGGPKTFAREGMIKRYRELATAIEAELAGDRARAADLLGALVRDPTYMWDYPERMALARNLAALGRTRELRELCTDLAHPAIFHAAFLPARSACKRLLHD